MTLTATYIVEALALDRSPASGWMIRIPPATVGYAWAKAEPHELFVRAERGGLWVRADGSTATAWIDSDHHAQHFGFLGRLRIRAAVRRWARLHP